MHFFLFRLVPWGEREKSFNESTHFPAKKYRENRFLTCPLSNPSWKVAPLLSLNSYFPSSFDGAPFSCGEFGAAQRGEPFLLSVSPASFRRRRKAKAYCSISYLLLSHRESPLLSLPPTSPLPMPSDGQLRRESGRTQDKLWVAHTSSFSSCTRKGGRRKQRGRTTLLQVVRSVGLPLPPLSSLGTSADTRKDFGATAKFSSSFAPGVPPFLPPLPLRGK